MLRAIDLPERGGDTIWASMYAAYDALSPTMQAMIEPLTAFHDMGAGIAFISKAGPELTAMAKELCPGAEHPVVRTHPDTGRRYLYVNRGFTQRIVGLHPRAGACAASVRSSSPTFAPATACARSPISSGRPAGWVRRPHEPREPVAGGAGLLAKVGSTPASVPGLRAHRRGYDCRRHAFESHSDHSEVGTGWAR